LNFFFFPFTSKFTVIGITWLSDFTSQVNKHEHGLFYVAVANLTLKWLEIEIEDLNSIEYIAHLLPVLM